MASHDNQKHIKVVTENCNKNTIWLALYSQNAREDIPYPRLSFSPESSYLIIIALFSFKL